MRAIPRMVSRLLVAALPWIAIASLPMQMPAHLTAEQSEFFGSAIKTVTGATKRNAMHGQLTTTIPHTRTETRAEPVLDPLRAKRRDFNQ